MFAQQKTLGPYVLGFNGPPKVGKDTIATCVQTILDREGCNIPVHRQALAATMRDGAAAILGMNGGDKWYNEIKDQPLDVLGGGTFRRFMIDMSESFVKRIHGQDFWARLMHSRNQTWWNSIPSIMIVTDIGFKDEVQFLCEHSTSYLNVRVDRPGTDFSNDSRGYCAAQSYGGKDFALTNDGTPEEAAEEVVRMMHKLGWPVF